MSKEYTRNLARSGYVQRTLIAYLEVFMSK